MNQALKEPAVRFGGRSPEFLEYFMAVEKLTAIEQVDALLKEVSGIFLYLAAS